jgi:formate hydrogenlyase transcriptional activator
MQESIETLRTELEERLSLATDSARAHLWHLEIDSGRIWTTEKAKEFFGFPPERELDLESFLSIVHPEDREKLRLTVEEAVRSGEDKGAEYRIVRPDGSIRWVLSRGRMYPASTGQSARLMGVSIDMTERKQVEQALENRLRFERLLADLSARFVKIAPDRVDSEIEYGLRQILEFFQVDRVALVRALPDRPTYQITHCVYGKDIPAVPVGVELPRSLAPWAFEKLAEKHEVVSFSRLDDLPPEANENKQTYVKWGIRSTLQIPIITGGSGVHVIAINSVKSERVWPEELFPRLQLLGEIFVNALERKQIKTELEKRLIEIEELKQRLERENIYLREEVKLLAEHADIVGQSVAMKKVLSRAELVAQTDSTVFLLGETGTGKELLARAIHGMSLRKDRPLVTVNCASLPPTLIESELFGREPGAYTGALTKMIGRFEIANGSTIFLDEIGEVPLDLQSKLLRVLEEGRFERLGSTKPIQVNVRIIAATNREIEREVKDGKFRRDLFYRLNVFPIVIPPLRERPEDIPLLVRAFVKEFQKRMGKETETIPKKTLQALQSYSWPGNVRELRNLIEHAMILSKGKTLEVDVPNRAPSEKDAAGKLEDMERKHIVAVLEKTGWRIGGQGGAAEVLGLVRTTLHAKMKKLGIKRSNKPMTN